MSEIVLATPAEFRAAVQALIANKDLSGALRIAEQASARFPGNLGCRLQSGWVLEQAGRLTDAVMHYQALRADHPGDVRVATRLAIVRARLGQADEALTLYRSAIAEAALSEPERTQIVRKIAAPLRRNKEAAALLAARVSVTPDDAALLRDAANAAFSNGHLSDAVDYLERSAVLGTMPAWGHAVQIEGRWRLARRTRRWPVADGCLVTALDRALTQYPHHPAFVRFLNRIPLPQGEWTRLYMRARAGMNLQSKDGFLLYEMMLAALQADDRPFAESLLTALAPGSEWAERVAPMAQILRRVHSTVWERSRLNDDKAAELQIVRAAGAAATLLVFATLTGNFMMLPLAMLDGLLADLPVNVIYLRDTTSLAPGLRGFRSFGPRVEDTVARLRQEIAGLGAPRLLTLGASASGLSAIRYGARLGAERVVTFGALTSLGPDFAHTAIRSGTLTPAAMAEAESRFRDVASELAEAPGMRVAFHYGEDYKLDADHAARVKGLPGVVVHPAPGVNHHYVVLSMIAAGTFRDAVWSG